MSTQARSNLISQAPLELVQSPCDRELAVGREAALDIRRIQRILPHRYPMLLVDRVVEITGDSRAIGIKNVTFNDIFFQGHYPGTPIMIADGRRSVVDIGELLVALGESAAVEKSAGSRAAADEQDALARRGAENPSLQRLD